MSQENVETVRRAFEAFNRAGLDALLEHFHPDVEYDITAGIGPWAGLYHGRGAVRPSLRTTSRAGNTCGWSPRTSSK